MRLVLDTNAYSALFAGETEVRRILEDAEWIGLPVTVVGELVAGFLGGKRAARNLADLEEFLATPGVELLPVGRDQAERYGALVFALRERGSPIPTNDLWIAASVLTKEARLLSRDRHFDAVPGLIRLGF